MPLLALLLLQPQCRGRAAKEALVAQRKALQHEGMQFEVAQAGDSTMRAGWWLVQVGQCIPGRHAWLCIVQCESADCEASLSHGHEVARDDASIGRHKWGRTLVAAVGKAPENRL